MPHHKEAFKGKIKLLFLLASASILLSLDLGIQTFKAGNTHESPGSNAIESEQSKRLDITQNTYNWTVTEGHFSEAVLEKITPGLTQGALWNEGLHNYRLAFVGILCKKEDISARLLIRRTNFQLLPPEITAKFVVCLPTSAGSDPLLWAEIRSHNDIYLLNCTENMNHGKTLQFFRTVRRDFPDYLYYSKADTDSYLLFHNLALALDSAPRCLFYGGRCNTNYPSFLYMSGSFYVLSQDLVKSLEQCGGKCSAIDGTEDYNTAEHLRVALPDTDLALGDLGSNYTVLYDRQARETIFQPWHVVVHPLKTPEEWWNAHNQFAKIITSATIENSTRIQFWNWELSKSHGIVDCG